MTVNWGDGSGNTTFTANTVGTLAPASHAFVDDGVYTVTVTAAEENGAGASGSGTFTVTVANVVPVTDAQGNPVYEKNPDGSIKTNADGPVPKTRWALNMKPEDQSGMPDGLRQQMMQSCYDSHEAHKAAVAKKNAEIAKKNAETGSTDPLMPMPDPIPELAGYQPPAQTA